ncbi:MAG: hypothetical protein ABI758_04740 [Candidatus Woesebacteria bacterium]
MSTPQIGDDAVIKATGKNWKEWFSILDTKKASQHPHIEIAKLIQEKYLKKKERVNVVTNGGWWAQMITVEYERARGIRKINEQADGFMVAVTKTVPGTVESLQKKWEKILVSDVVVSKKLVRIPSKTKRAQLRYSADVGRVIVSFDKRANGKAWIAIESTKLPRKSLVEPTREFWKKIVSTIENA